ncbi:MAG: ATP-binding cassette domain-containing protein [Oscillospiraceae bacterium]
MTIKISNLSKTIKGAKIIDNINIEMNSGNVYGLCGYNGCGKTMLMRLISGLILPSEGEIFFDNNILGKDMDFPESMGILIERPEFLVEHSGFENLHMLASIKGIASDEILKKTLLRVGLNPEDRKKYQKYSLGMKQRLGIAAAIMETPDIVILDEPTNALDLDGIKKVQRIIREECERGAIVIMSCHDYNILEDVCDVIYSIQYGRITNTELTGRSKS